MADSREQLALELRRLQLSRHDAAIEHAARRRDLQLEHDLALQRRIFAQRAVVDRVDGALVALEDKLDLFDRARCLAARAAVQIAAAAGACPVALAAAHTAAARAAAAATTGHAFDQRRRATCQSAAAGVAAVGRGVDSAAAAGRVRRDQRARRQAGFSACADADTGAGADAGALLDVLLQLHCERRTADLGELVRHREQADTCGLAAHVVEHFARRLVRLRPARFGHRRRLRRLGLGRVGLVGARLGFVLRALRLDHRWRRQRLAFEQQLREARRQFLRLRAIEFRRRHDQHREAQHDGECEHAMEDAAEARIVIGRWGPREDGDAERDGDGGAHWATSQYGPFALRYRRACESQPKPVRTELVEVPVHPEPIEGTELVEVPVHPELVEVPPRTLQGFDRLSPNRGWLMASGGGR